MFKHKLSISNKVNKKQIRLLLVVKLIVKV
jgi:hypothetical protein